MVLFEVDSFLDADGSEDEVVGEPAENNEGCSCDSAESEYNKLGVVLCDDADVLMGEGWLLVVVLGLPVYDDKADDCYGCAYLEEEEGWEAAFEHGY